MACVAGGDIVPHRLFILPGLPAELLQGGEGLPGIELVPVGGAIPDLSRQSLVFRAQLPRFDGDAFGPRSLPGSLGRLDLLFCRKEPGIQCFVGGPVCIHGPLGLVEVLHGPGEEVAPAPHQLLRPERIGGKIGGRLVELLGEAGGIGVRDPRLDPLLCLLVQ